jgi:type IV pilus assembly protein PilA
MNRKAFTLIELLVVVAIIGILAAVGVVAYSGYTAAAKVNATKANYKSVVRYVKNELAKCDLDNTAKIFIDPLNYWTLDCKDKSTQQFAATLPRSVYHALKDKGFRNPYRDRYGLKSGGRADAPDYNGYVILWTKSLYEIGIETCYKTPCGSVNDPTNKLMTIIKTYEP